MPNLLKNLLPLSTTHDIVVSRPDNNFDRACDSAYRMAVMYYGIDEDGHSERVRDWDRCSCGIEVEFLGHSQFGGYLGMTYEYKFRARIHKND